MKARPLNLCALVLVVFSLIAHPSSLISNALAQTPPSFADLVEKLSPAVVNISTTQKVKGNNGVQFFGAPFEQLPDTPEMEPFREFFERFGQQQGQGGKGDGSAPEREVTSLGSGFIIEASGFIITNNHVIDDAEEVMVIMTDNSKYKAKVIGSDKKTDLALLKIDAKKDLPFVQMGDSDKTRVGDWVIAIGNPYGLGGSVTQGIISARQRSINAGPFDDFLQTDAPINRGNSGGPLFNMSGEVIGINSAIFSPSGGNIGIGFAVPVSLAKPVIAQLKQYGRTHRGWLGVKIQEVNDELAESVGLPKAAGAFVADVGKDSPAAKAGVQVGDVITHYNGKEISAMRNLPRLVAETKIGSTVDLTYFRKGKSATVKVLVGELNETDEEEKADKQDASPKEASGTALLGMELAPLTDKLRQQFRLEDKQQGLVILKAKAGSEALKHGISTGDVVLEMNNEPVKSIEDARKQLADVKKAGRKFVLVKVQHEKEQVFIPLPVEDEKK